MVRSTSRLRIVLDARALTHAQHGGFRSATRALVQGLCALPTHDTEILLYIHDRLPRSIRRQLPESIQTRELRGPKLKTELWLFRQQLVRDSPDLVHGMMNYIPIAFGAVAGTATIHDALGVKHYPFSDVPRTGRERAVHWYTRQMTERTMRSARRIATDSDASAQELAPLLDVLNGCRALQVVYPGVALPTPRTTDRSEKMLLAVASPDPRKNLTLLHAALWLLAREFDMRPDLHIVCGSEALAGRFRSWASNSAGIRVRLHVGLSDRKLAKLYARATAFIFPSRWEGFGLPPLEAMRCGCAVASSNAPCLPETLGSAPVFFSPDDARELATAAHRLLVSPTERIERGARGRTWARVFSCDAYASAMVDFWHRAAASTS